MLVLLVVIVVVAVLVAYKFNQKKAVSQEVKIEAPEKIEPIVEVQAAPKPKKAPAKKSVKKEK